MQNQLQATVQSFVQEGGSFGSNIVNTPRGQVVKTQYKTGQVIKGESRINYVPFEKKVIQYEDRQYVEKRPIKRKVVEYQQKRYFENVPRQVTKTDYYAVENIKQYVKEVIPEKKIQMVAKERKVKKVEYIPVQKQIVHYPNSVNLQTAIHQGSSILSHSGFQIGSNTQYKPLNPSLIYNVGNQSGFGEPANSNLIATNVVGQFYSSNQQKQFLGEVRSSERAETHVEQIYQE